MKIASQSSWENKPERERKKTTLGEVFCLFIVGGAFAPERKVSVHFCIGLGLHRRHGKNCPKKKKIIKWGKNIKLKSPNQTPTTLAHAGRPMSAPHPPANKKTVYIIY